ncbi:MAG: hypothetical protein JNL74_01445 [Fibrobacteres bacterium]|nr:hypothetical protein [Fibrobacterota bacterium]
MEPLPPLHISLMVLAFILLFIAVVKAFRKKGAWVKSHRLMAGLSVISALLAFVAMFTFKANVGFPHFSSPHGIMGAVILFLLILMPIAGTLMTKGFQSLRKPHKITGRIILVLVVLALTSGLFSLMQNF